MIIMAFENAAMMMMMNIEPNYIFHSLTMTLFNISFRVLLMKNTIVGLILQSSGIEFLIEVHSQRSRN